MAIPTLSGSYIDETYGRLIQTSGSEYADGFGNPIHFSSGPINSVQINKDGTNFTGSSALIFESNTLTLTGSLKITGSTTQTGNNTLIGNTLLSGSIIISGSHSASTPTIKIYGDMETDGVIKFLPVNFDIDPTISGSYIFVSGSTDDLYFSQNGAGYSNITRLRWLEGNLYTGLLNGGIVSQVNTNTYQVSSGSGIVVNLNASFNTNPYPTIKYVNWGNLTKTIDALSASYDQQFVAIDNTGNIYAQAIPYTDGDYNTKIPIGIVIHQNHSTINAVQTFPSVAYGWKQRSSDFIRAFGPLKIAGYNLAQSGSSTRGLVLSGGTSYVDGRNYIVDPNNPSYIVEATGISTSKIFRYRQSGSEWVYDTNNGAGYTDIDPTNYSNNGTLTPVPTNDWSIQRVFYFPNSATKAFYIYYGNNHYASKDLAIAAITTEPFSEAPNTTANAIFVGYMLLRYNASFNTAASYEFRSAGMFRSSGTGGSSGGGTGGITNLAGLTDVQLSTLSYGDLLMYDDTHWFNTKNLIGSYTVTGSLMVSGSTSIEGNLGVQNSISTTTNTKRFGQIGGGNNYFEVEADSWLATIIGGNQTGIFINTQNRTYLFGDRVNNNTQILIDDIAQTINMSGSVTFNGNVTSTGGFSGSFAEKMTTTTLGNTDPLDINIISTDITITGAGTYIVDAIYSGVGGVIIFPDPSLYVGQTVRIQNRTNRPANIANNGNEPVDITSSAITTINDYTTKTFIAGERTTGAYSWMEI